MLKKLRIIIDGYLEKTYLDKEGGKHCTLEYSVKDSFKIAQLELMGRDLNNHLPILLRTVYEVSPEKNKKESYTKVTNSPQQRHFIVRKTA